MSSQSQPILALKHATRTAALIGIAASLALSGCARSAVIAGRTYEPYGLANKDEVRDPKVHYRLSTGNIILAVIFSETLLVPGFVAGWQLYEPTGPA